jgi:hypothetical protein
LARSMAVVEMGAVATRSWRILAGDREPGEPAGELTGGH